MRRHYPVIREFLVVFCTFGGMLIGWCAGHESNVEMGSLIGAFTGMGACGALADAALRR